MKIFHTTGDRLEMSEKEVILTQEGLSKLENELDHLKSVKRREVAERIKVAIGYGDISENSEYEDAKNEQAFIEGRIITLEKMLRNARIINSDDVDTDTVSVGSTVTMKDLEFGDTVEYTIVGTAESDPFLNKISNESPVGKAILGKQKGAIVDVNVPAGVIKYEIIDIKK
ncbi:transcription elongation factor GreA [Paenibacillus larvae subsp. larvae DSM 25430]|uniref:Transcription elongation factor GreA n=3 Tax=Paenibacillus larvae TaxID=1464 RepID=V9W992_9BACL|nr:transcription elongation factor GreA [Paenibacillus larvae subsp. larvae DSM 25430]PCK72483.1 transcription elongation factor GreA-like protein [Paenibacillus larvae subsp. larvae B-3650]